MAGETDWELQWRMSDSEKPGDKSLYIIHVVVFYCVLVLCSGLLIWAFYMASHETPGKVYREKCLLRQQNVFLRRLMYGEQTKN
ncbi:MAG: hypothetical protein GX184_09805 [Clostridiaceae bacterium]|nr:hypothetical protein [Clostridiaceae bacterium]